MATPGTAPDTGTPPGFREIVIDVGLNALGEVEVSLDYFNVSKKGNEEVRWKCVQKHEHPTDRPCFTVEFDNNDSPFYEFQFSSDAPVSGLVRRSVLASTKRYEYTVRIGEKSLDPGGGVRK